MKIYIYIIIGIIWFIYNAFKNTQKKAINSPETPAAPQETKEMDIKTIFEELLTGKQKDTPEIKPVEIIPEHKTPAFIPRQDFNIADAVPIMKRKKSNLQKQNSISTSILQEEEAGDKVFDLRQAIIFSEILKKPEY